MDEAKILKLAQQAGMMDGGTYVRSAGENGATVAHMLRFAELVAAAEREACAKLCEESENVISHAEAIRNRSQ